MSKFSLITENPGSQKQRQMKVMLIISHSLQFVSVDFFFSGPRSPAEFWYLESILTPFVTLLTDLQNSNRLVLFFSPGGDGGWGECVWSETLGQCFSPSYLPVICLAGRCGRIIRYSSSHCMESCARKQQCSTCMTSYNCGWCAEKGTSGEGQCFEGGLQGMRRELALSRDHVPTNSVASSFCIYTTHNP